VASIELVQDTATAVTFYPEAGALRPSSATLAFKSAGGTTKSAPSVSVVSIGSAGTASVSSVTSQTVVVVDDATNIAAGEAVWLSCADGWQGAVMVDEISGTTVTLDAAPPGTITTAATLHGLKCSATVPASVLDTRGMGYRLEWTVTDSGSGVTTYQQMAAVVRMRFADPVTSADAKRYVAGQWPGWAQSATAGWFRRLAIAASDYTRQLLVAAGDYPHLVGPHDAFKPVGLDALKVLLVDEGLTPPGHDRSLYLSEQEERLNRTLRRALANAQIDRDDSGGLTAGDVQGLMTIRAFRA